MRTLETNDWILLNNIIYKIYTVSDITEMREQFPEKYNNLSKIVDKEAIYTKYKRQFTPNIRLDYCEEVWYEYDAFTEIQNSPKSVGNHHDRSDWRDTGSRNDTRWRRRYSA